MKNIPMHCWDLLKQHCTRFLLIKWCPKSIKITLNRIFSYLFLSGASRTTLHRFFMWYDTLGTILCRSQRVLRQHWTRFFPEHWCLEPQRKHCIEFLSPLHMPEPYVMLFKSLQTTLHRSNFYAILFERLQTTLYRKNHMQCLNTHGTTLYRKNSLYCCPTTSRQHCAGTNPGNVVWMTLFICILCPLHQKIWSYLSFMMKIG